MPQIAQPHGRAELIHLAVGPDLVHRFRTVDAEVLQPGQPDPQRLITEAGRAALNGVEHLGGVEAEAGQIPKAPDPPAAVPDAEGVGRVIEDLQTMVCGNFLYFLHRTDIPVHMNRENGAGPARYQVLKL